MSAVDPLPDQMALSNDPIVAEAMKRFEFCSEWEATARDRFLEDIKFANADADNGWQWPNQIRRIRDVDQKPCLTINIVQQHNLQIINQGKQNKQGVKISAVGNGATVESSKVLRGIIRHIEYQSRADDAYSCAREFQVEGGIGWWRIVTDYAGGDGPEAFNQEIYLRRVWDPLSIYLDPDIQEKDGSDAKFGFVFDLAPKADFKSAYPKYADLVGDAPLGESTGNVPITLKDHIMLCEYFRRVPKKDKIYSFIDPTTGQRKTLRASKMHQTMIDAVVDEPLTKWRDVWDNVVEWYLIAGEKIIDKTIWLGSYIPLIRILGKETVIDGVLDRKGHTRGLKDSQRMFNYNSSASVEFVANQTKTPWLTPIAAMEEVETYWESANRVNHAYLPWKHVDDEGNPIPSPTKIAPPTAGPAYETGMTTAFNQMMMASGQWQNQMGMQGNERTGAAIKARQGQGDTATYHFEDNFRVGIVNCGRQLIELIPKIYDTRRVIKIQADDGTDMEIDIDPAARQAYLENVNHQQEVVKRIFNPNLGKYEVEADMGPAWGTKREQTVEALTLILTQNPGLTGIIGDLLLNAMDFDEAQEAAQRLKRMVPPQALGKGPTQTEQQLQQALQEMQQKMQILQMENSKLLERLGKESIKLAGKDQMRDIDVFKAYTDRTKVYLDHGIDNRQLDNDMAQMHLDAMVQASQGDDESKTSGSSPAPAPIEAPPMPGARKAPDGEWYLADPTRRGKYLRIGPMAVQRKASI